MTLPNDKPLNEEQMERDKISRCLRSDDGKVLTQRVAEYVRRCQLQLNTARDVVDIHRYQGQIQAYETILKLREDR